MSELPMAGPYLLPPEKYPVKIEAFHVETERLLWTLVIEEPPEGVIPSVPIPGTGPDQPARIKTTYADDETAEAWPE